MGETVHPYFVPTLRGKEFSLSPSMMLAVGILQTLFIKIGKVSLSFWFAEDFAVFFKIMNGGLILSNDFSVLIDMIM